MYLPYFVTYIAAGLIIALAVFFWALRNGQFRDQQRARFLPLEADPEARGAAVRKSRFARLEIAALFFLAAAGLAASAAVVVFALINANRW